MIVAPPGGAAHTGRAPGPGASLGCMPSFDVVSEVDQQEIRNAVDQASREVATRYDFKNTNSSLELTDTSITLRSSTEDRLAALRVVLEEKLVKRKVPLKALDAQKPEPAGGSTYRQLVKLKEGISTEKAKEIVKHVKDTKIKVQASIQGDVVRVSGKKRDDLQAAIAAIKAKDFDLPLQFTNFRE